MNHKKTIQVYNPLLCAKVGRLALADISLHLKGISNTNLTSNVDYYSIAITCTMELKKNEEPEKKKDAIQDKTEQWIDKAEAFIDDTGEKIHKSDAYKKADQSFEKATLSIFRKAGSLWGNFKNQNDKKDTK